MINLSFLIFLTTKRNMVKDFERKRKRFLVSSFDVVEKKIIIEAYTLDELKCDYKFKQVVNVTRITELEEVSKSKIYI